MSHRLALLVVALSVVVIALVGCGQNTTTPTQFREDCEAEGGTYVDTNGRDESCIYNKEQP